jgi:hypothetical protein
MVMSVGFDNLLCFGQFLCPALGDWNHHRSFAFFPRKSNRKTNGSIIKCFSGAFQRMVMSVGFDNLLWFGQFLYNWQKSPSVLKQLISLPFPNKIANDFEIDNDANFTGGWSSFRRTSQYTDVWFAQDSNQPCFWFISPRIY